MSSLVFQYVTRESIDLSRTPPDAMRREIERRRGLFAQPEKLSILQLVENIREATKYKNKLKNLSVEDDDSFKIKRY